MGFHKKKNRYDLLEIEYKDKYILLEFLIDIGTELIKLWRENNEYSVPNIYNLSDVDEDQILCKKLFNLYKEKINYYKKLKTQKKQNVLLDIKSGFNSTRVNLTFIIDFRIIF